MKIAFVGIPILFILVIIIPANNAYASCPGEPGFNCNNYPESNLSKNPQIVNLKVSPSIPKIGDMFTVTATLVNNSTVPIVVNGGKCSAQDTQAELFTIILDNHVKNKAENINCAGVGWSPLLDPGKNITGTSPDYTTNYVATEPGTATITVTFSYHAIIQRDPIQTSDEQTISKSFQFLIHDVNKTYAQKPPAYFASPLQQFKEGIKPEYVKCNQNLNLIIKAEDGSFACVTIKTGIKLVLREWAATFGTGISTSDYYTKCDIPYPQSDTGVAVLYMPTNTIGKICIKYSNPNDTPVPIVGGIRIFDPNNSYQNATDITTWRGSTNDMIPKGNSTMVYWIKTGNQTGFYGLDIICGGMPFAVGYDNNSKIVSSDFPFVGVTHSCPVILYDVKIEGLTGIGVRYIPFP